MYYTIMVTQIKKEKIVEYKAFQCKDGKIFDNVEDANIHEMVINKEAIYCPECNGTGHIYVEEWEENYHTGAPRKLLNSKNCPKCHGRKYLKIVY